MLYFKERTALEKAQAVLAATSDEDSANIVAGLLSRMSGGKTQLPPIGTTVYVQAGYDCVAVVVKEHREGDKLYVFEPGISETDTVLQHIRYREIGSWSLAPFATGW